MADDLQEFDKNFKEFVEKLKAEHSNNHHLPPKPFLHPAPRDWYDGYDHSLPPKPFPPRKPCPNCTSKSLEKYGFVPIVGGKYYTGSGKACCPVKVTITKILANEIQYKDAAGTIHSKTFHDFMTSSWRDKSL